MSGDSANLAVGIVGLILLLLGLLLLGSPLAGTPLTGVGASVLATAVSNWILTRRLGPLPITSIVEALAQKTEFMRTGHEAELVFRLEGDSVRLDRAHRYCLSNPSRFTRPRRIALFTDASAAPSGKHGGFVLVLEPDGTKLEGEALFQYVTEDSGKHLFRKTYNLQPGSRNAFEFHSFEYYRLIDRLSWTVQDLSENFRVRIRNQTGRPNAFTIKINHHREEAVQDQMKYLTTDSEEIVFEFNAEVLPYQGFEVMWDLSTTR